MTQPEEWDAFPGVSLILCRSLRAVEALVKRASVCTSHMSASFLASVLWSLGTLSHQLLPASSAAFSRRLGNIAHEMGAQVMERRPRV